MAYRRAWRLHNLAMRYCDRAEVLRMKSRGQLKKAMQLEAAALKEYEATCGEEPTLSILRESLDAIRAELGEEATA